MDGWTRCPTKGTIATIAQEVRYAGRRRRRRSPVIGRCVGRAVTRHGSLPRHSSDAASVGLALNDIDGEPERFSEVGDERETLMGAVMAVRYAARGHSQRRACCDDVLGDGSPAVVRRPGRGSRSGPPSMPARCTSHGRVVRALTITVWPPIGLASE